ncbi:MAG: hypothetical protein N4A33_10445 [Bacteriovoracaceae bacterium]|jgi:hypothetical protein|nr:hypothetical protein [Bacteriovoracaceae bacterium]
MKLILIFCLFFNFTYALDIKSATGSLFVHQKDSEAFIKESLLHSSFINAIKKGFKKQGLSVDEFWQKYKTSLDERIQESVKNLQEQESFQKLDDEEKRYKIRSLKFKVKKSFLSLNSTITSYSIKSITISPRNPNLRIMKVDVKLDEIVLTKKYFSLVKKIIKSSYDSLYLDISYTNYKFDFTQLGVSNESDFTSVVDSHWLSWFEKYKTDNILKIESKKISDIQNTKSQEYSNSLLLKVDVDMRKIDFNDDLQKYTFAFTISGYLMDIYQNKVLTSFSTNKEIKTYTNVSKDRFSSLVANYIYRQPMSKFGDIKNYLNKPKQLLSRYKVVFENYKSIKQIEQIEKQLISLGYEYGLTSNTSSLTQLSYVLDIYCSANKKQLVEVFNRLRDRKKFDLIDMVDTLSVKFK